MLFRSSPMYLKPVKVSVKHILYSSAMRRIILVDTMVVIIMSFVFFSVFSLFSFFLSNMYSERSSPVMFPVIGMYLFVFLSFAYTPSLSASGSVASTMSASFSSASFKASSNAFLSSGLGFFTVENSGSGSSCSFTVYMFVTPCSFSMRFTRLFPVP